MEKRLYSQKVNQVYLIPCIIPNEDKIITISKRILTKTKKEHIITRMLSIILISLRPNLCSKRSLNAMKKKIYPKHNKEYSDKIAINFEKTNHS